MEKSSIFSIRLILALTESGDKLWKLSKKSIITIRWGKIILAQLCFLINSFSLELSQREKRNSSISEKIFWDQ